MSSIGFNKLEQQALYGGATIDAAAKLFLSVLNGEGTTAQNNTVIVNAALALQTVHFEQSFSDCLLQAKESLESKKALKAYQSLINN